MEEIYKSVLLLVHSLTQLSGTTYSYSQDPTEENGEKIVDIVDKCEKKFLQVKEEIVKMVQEVEQDKDKSECEMEEIVAIPTNEGFLIKES